MTPVTRFAIEVDSETEPLSGSLECEGQARDFVGWLGLIAAIETALARAADPEN